MAHEVAARANFHLEINRIICDVTASLTVTDDEGYVNIAELCQLVGLVNQGRLPSAQPFASSFGWFDSHNKGDSSLKKTMTKFVGMSLRGNWLVIA